MLGACLPSLVTLIVFIVLFAGFRQMVGYQFALDYKESYDVYTAIYEAEMNASLKEALEAAGLESYEDLPLTAEKAEAHAAAVDKAQTAVYDHYFSEENQNRRKFLWIHNVFVPDSWEEGVPDYLVVTGQEGRKVSRCPKSRAL